MDNSKHKFFVNCILIVLSVCSIAVYAHESWLLTPANYVAWNNKPIPNIFHEIQWKNSLLFLLAMLFTLTWLLIGQTHLADSWKKLADYLVQKTKIAAFILRITLAITLFIAAFGLIPREGYAALTYPCLLVPDLQLQLLSPFWYWLQWLELIVATLLMLGLFTRLCAVILLLLIGLAFVLFGNIMLAYGGYFIGISIYLLMQGGGAFAVAEEDLPSTYVEHLKPLATFILRMLVGVNFIYLAIVYKLLQPNLTIGILETHHAFTFGLSYPTFVFLMLLVELFSGILLLSGVMIRALSLILFIVFMVVSVIVNENIFAHTFIYGILCVFFINGAGAYSTYAK